MTILKAFLVTVLYFIAIQAVSLIPIPIDLYLIDGFWKLHYLIESVLILGLMIWFINRHTEHQIRNLPQSTPIRWYVLAILLGIIFVFSQNPLNELWNMLNLSEHPTSFDLNKLENLAQIDVIPTVLLIPVAEELFFRQYVQHGLMEKNKPWIAILVTAALFGLIHGPFRALISEYYVLDWHHSYITLFGGLISGVLFWKSKSIGPSVAFHGMWNLTTFLT